MANDVRLRIAMDGAAEVVAGTERIGGGLNNLGTQAQAASKSSDTLRTALASIATLATAVAVIKMADAVTTLNTQLNLSTGSAQKAAQAYESLFQIAQKGRVSFTELGTTYAAIARAGNEMGVSQGRLLAVTESISQAMTIGGGSAQSMQAALVQLGQGLSSGTLRGEELNSIMEQTPRLAKAIADGLGVPIGELRKLGETGQLTAQQVINALEKAGPQLAKEMASSTLTVGQAMTLLGNSATKMVGEMDAASGASASLAGALKYLSGAMDSVGETIRKHETAFAVITAGLAGAATVAGIYALGAAFVAATPAVVAFAAAFMATPLGPIALALAAVTAGVMGLKAAADSAAKSETGLGYALANLDERIAKLDASQESTWASGKKRLEEMRAERARLAAELALLSNKGLDTRAEDARLGATTATFKEKEAAVKAYQSLKQELSGVDKDFQTHLKQLQAMRDTDQISQKQYVEDVIELIKKEGGARKAATKPDHKADAFQADVARAYTKALEDLNKEELKSTAIAEGYTKTQEILRGVMASPEFAAMSFRKKEEIILAASQAEAESDHATAITKTKKAYDDYVASAKSSADGVDRNLKALQDETNAYAVAAEKNISLAEAIDVVAMARLEDEVIKAKIAKNYDAVAQLEREIEARKKLAPLIKAKDAHKKEIEAGKDAAKAVNDEYKKGWEETDRLAREAFTGWAENGTSAAEAIGKSLKKALLSAIYEATIRPIALQLYSSVVGGAAGAAGGSAVGSGIGAAIGSATGASAFGGAFTAGIGGGVEAFSAGATMVAEAQGLTSAMAGAGQMLGAAMPYLAAIAIAAAYFEGRPESSANLGDSSATYGSNGARLALETTNGLKKDTTSLTEALQKSYVGAAKSLGIGLAQANYNVNVNNGADAKNPNTIIDSTVNGRTFSSGEISQKDAAGLQLAASRAVLNALQASDMPAYMAKVLNDVVASTASQEQINTALTYATSLKTVREAMLEARTSTEVMQDTVAKGFADLGTSAESFKSDFVAAIDAGLTPDNFSAWNGLKTAMDALADSAKGASDSILSEIKRIRGISATSSTYAGAQSAFAISSAQARAGDLTAAAALPALSSAMLALAKNNVATGAELRYIEATTANSLEATLRAVSSAFGTTLPSFAVGTDFVPHDMVAKIHRGERITPAAFNPTVGGGGSGSGGGQMIALIAEVKDLKERLANVLERISSETRATATHTSDTSSTLKRVVPDGDAIQVRIIA